ncbi:MAG TPA: cytochrome c peroxidase [Saprospiraceae bacterium]|nr:cytochrome c peroxidase [Saprospiraceae bacterium]
MQRLSTSLFGNKMPKFQLQVILAIVCLGFMSCQKDDPVISLRSPQLPAQLANYALPDISPCFWVDQSRFMVTDAGATLGRVLFYDKILSKDNTISCRSCHLQEKAFSDPVQFSSGIDGQVLRRHTPSITNVYDDPMLFWDGRAKSVTDLVLKPVRNHKEMGLDDMDFLVAKIRKAPYYESLFKQAYGADAINKENIANALGQFLSSMITGQSKYDDVMCGTSQFTASETRGSQVFFGEGRCYQCHGGLDFNQRGSFFIDVFPFGGGWEPAANIGLDKEYADQGMGEFDQSLEGVFKIPSLRNVAVTAPYMHDGRFSSLEEVINHYSENIADHPNLANELRDWQNGGPGRLNLSPEDKSALVSFLKTLTDENYMHDEKFSDPFK